MKTCKTCNQSLDESKFYKHQSTKDKLRPDCKKCVNAYARNYEKTHRDAVCAARRRRYRGDKAKEYREKTKTKRSEYRRKYYLDHREELLQYWKDYQVENRLQIRAKQRERRKNDPRLRLRERLSKRLRRVLKGERKRKSILQLLGCSVEFARKHLELQFRQGMSWENYGTAWDIDHIKPLLGKGRDLTDHKQLAEVCHYTNLQPLWKQENQRKGNRETSNLC